MTPESTGPRDFDLLLLARYLRGEASPDERGQAERWLAASPENRAFADALRAAWERPPVADFDPDDTVWRRLEAEIAAPRPRPVLVTEPGGPRQESETSRREPGMSREPEAPRVRSFQPGGRRRSWLVAAAAAAVIVVSAGTALLRPWGRSAETAAPAAQPMREIATRRGERLALRLADGTRVVLAAESRLRLPEGFGGRGRRAREVHLDGQAFFEVVHDSTRPFRVHTPSGVAEDLGTEFVVTSYPETGGTRVIVASGVVALSRPGPGGVAPLTLRRGDLGTIDTAGAASFTRGVDLQPYIAWTGGTLVFDGTPLGDALPVLRRWYDLDIRLGDPRLARERLTATFQDAPVSQVLELLALSLDLSVERRGETVIVRAKGGGPR